MPAESAHEMCVCLQSDGRRCSSPAARRAAFQTFQRNHARSRRPPLSAGIRICVSIRAGIAFRAADVEHALLHVDVCLVESEQLLEAEAGVDEDDPDRRERCEHLGADRLDLSPAREGLNRVRLLPAGSETAWGSGCPAPGYA